MSSRRSPEDRVADLAVEMCGLAPYSAVNVRELGDDDGFEACLPASPVREYAIERVDRYFVPDGGGAIVLVPEDEEVPVVPRSQVAGPELSI
jgi:hypothetical protein